MFTMKSIIAFLFFCLFCYFAEGQFSIDYDHDTFVMDGEPFRYVSGSVHYFRLPRQYWRDRLRKLAAAGANTVSTYVEWSQHEREQGTYDFKGDLNITEFVLTAEEEGLKVILRVGPYICAERDMGGFPYWLLRENPDVKLRVNDPRYTVYLEIWLDVLLHYVAPLLFGNGGPIITVQVENEYGFYGACDHDYTEWLAGVFKRYVGDKAVLFSTDGSSYGSLSCGKIPGVYATVDFGPGANVTEMYLNHKAVEPKGPFVNSEFYPGWLTHWGENWATRDTEGVIATLKDILNLGGNLNFYMFYGGTNLGFSAGANYGDTYQSDLTSYDYDAPITEAGDVTSKYSAIRDVLLNYFNLTTEMPSNTTKGNYGTLQLEHFATLTSPKTLEILATKTVSAKYPETFESISQDQGYVLYSTKLNVSGANASLTCDVRDLAHVYINDVLFGTLSREFQTDTVYLYFEEGDELKIYVENSGRINFGDRNNDFKGILSNVTIDGEVVSDWTMTGIDVNEMGEVFQLCQEGDCSQGMGFKMYGTTFQTNATSNIEYNGRSFPADTFLDVANLRKGVVSLNGHNLGRYWSTRGPQYSVYVPGAWLLFPPNDNYLFIMEEELQNDSLTVSFSETPIIGPPKF